jgi:hypothetical protein
MLSNYQKKARKTTQQYLSNSFKIKDKQKKMTINQTVRSDQNKQIKQNNIEINFIDCELSKRYNNLKTEEPIKQASKTSIVHLFSRQKASKTQGLSQRYQSNIYIRISIIVKSTIHL